MISHPITYCLCIVLLFLSACHLKTTTNGIEDALSQAKNNKEELFKVIQHYQHGDDSLKLKAAIFLIENMSDKYYLTGKSIDEYYTFIDSVYQIKQEEYDIPAIYQGFQEQAKYLKEEPIVNRDVQTVSADYLINNIEEAFKVWNKPWNTHLNFEEFCELILPYRVGNEMLEEWRSLYSEHFSPILQSDTIRTAKEACTVINNELIQRPIHLGPSPVIPIDLRPSTLQNMKFGLCDNYASLAVYAMRSVGIPVAKETIPHWGRNKGGHVFNVVYDNDGSSYNFSGAEQNPDEHLIRFKNEIPKVYRKTYGKQKGSLAMIHGNEDIPPIFKNAYQKDVTGNYPFIDAKDISVTLSHNNKNKKYVYLCVFDITGWFPIAWSQIENRRALFENVGPNIVYHVAYYEQEKIQPVGNPFLLDTLGHITSYIPEETVTDLVLERKKEAPVSLAHLPLALVGGKFEGADNPDLKNAVTFHTITEKPNFKYTTVLVDNSTPVKYVRYLSSDKTRGNMAEVEFYTSDSSIPLKGKVIGEYEPSIYYPQYGAANMFDGDALTFFHTNDTLSWGGLELNQPTSISKIRYIIRNDDNGIRKGHKYELFYMNKGHWQSLGKKIAEEDDQIVFKDAPQRALYWLRDSTKGIEERIFEINSSNNIIWH